jgi:hypothetical protein
MCLIYSLLIQAATQLLLDNIVDDVSDGEGDEEEAERQRVAMEIREDTERTLAVIAAVTEGRRITGVDNKRALHKDDLDSDMEGPRKVVRGIKKCHNMQSREDVRRNRYERQDRCDAMVNAFMQEHEDSHQEMLKWREEHDAEEKARGFLYKW